VHLSEINIFPIKSLKGISVLSAMVERRGLEMDRRWLLVDKDGTFLTQRELPKMATIRVWLRGDSLEVHADGAPKLRVEPLFDGPRVQALVWKTTSEAIEYDIDTSEWFSDALDTEVRLLYMPDDAGRAVNPLFDRGGDVVSFADGYPLMLLGEASLGDLNRRLAENADGGVRVPLLMNRFRANLVVAGSERYAEDQWVRIKVGDAIFRSTKPCERCVITTVDQSSGEVDGKEPLRTLATYRRARDLMPERCDELGVDPTAVLFGQNLIPETSGATVRVGDRVEVLDSR
jgi:uncharacterized protein YcbX